VARPRRDARLLVVFTRWPAPGFAKTRLIPALGPTGAAALARAMAEHTLRRVSGAGVPLEVRYDGGDERLLRGWLGEGCALRAQGGGDIGRRMARAVAEGIAGGADAVVLIGTDCPDRGEEDVRAAFEALAAADVVFGPATDGGYWLVGVRRVAGARRWPALFEGIAWGESRVFEESARRAAALGLTARTLRTLADVDRPGDLPVWERAAAREREEPPWLSVVVPTLEEARRVAAHVGALLLEPGVEVVVADGGSADATARIAVAAGARVVEGARGRAAQMNAGAAAASGRVLLFLHADTRPPTGFPRLIRAALADGRVAGGAFAFATDDASPVMRLIERGARWRARALGVVFGDQGIFARRSAFDACGGYPVLPLMEDAAFVRRLRQEGRFALLDAPAVSSARRWRRHGVWRTTAANALVTAAWLCGAGPVRLSRAYPRLLGKPRRIG
jgi:rSAM/selenodomain-associated transferase 2/rSAM/selenodomain-associated transferase 1